MEEHIAKLKSEASKKEQEKVTLKNLIEEIRNNEKDTRERCTHLEQSINRIDKQSKFTLSRLHTILQNMAERRNEMNDELIAELENEPQLIESLKAVGKRLDTKVFSNQV
jgi:predicted DNA-binding ribbon-helix-helix protein